MPPEATNGIVRISSAARGRSGHVRNVVLAGMAEPALFKTVDAAHRRSRCFSAFNNVAEPRCVTNHLDAGRPSAPACIARDCGRADFHRLDATYLDRGDILSGMQAGTVKFSAER